MIIVALSACKKNSDNKPDNTRLLNGTMSTNRYLSIWNSSRPIRNTNPYSLATIRDVKTILSRFKRPEIAAIGNQPLENNNLQYYCRINLNNQSSNAALKTWLESDSNRSVFDFPMDSVSMYPELFQERGIQNNFYQSTYAYTTVWANDPLPSNIDFNIIDTLYIPNTAEVASDWFLDVMAHILTSNISPNSMQLMDAFDTSIVGNIGRIYNLTLISGNSNAVKQFNNPVAPVGIPDLYEIGDRLYDVYDIRDYGNGNRADGRITFRETQLNVWEGIKNVRVKVVHFTVLTHTAHMYNTDDYGNFNLRWFFPGTGTMVFEFTNNKIKVIDADTKSTGAWIWSILNLPYAARHVEWYFYTQPSNIAVQFEHGTKKALWGMIMNGVREANQYAVQENLRSNVNHSPFLTVYARYSENRPSMGSGSAPMFAHTGANSAQLNYLYGLFGLVGSAPYGLSSMPDLLICQSENVPYTSNDLRQTIYHEYGHSLHYFKTGDLFWSDNVMKTIGQIGAPSYGTSINTIPGDFFALTEGWADYVGHSFGAKRYPSTVVFGETIEDQNGFTLYNATANYQTHLENNMTYFNWFIPRGLFYDLTDADRTAEFAFDRISGFTMNSIYHALMKGTNVPVYSIQQFRERWDQLHPNVNNALLFNHYNIQ